MRAPRPSRRRPRKAPRPRPAPAGAWIPSDWARWARAALETLEPEAWERGALGWTIPKVRRLQRTLQAVLLWIGLFFLALGALIASLYFPAVRIALLFATAALALLIGVWFLQWAFRVHRAFRRRLRALEELAEMTNAERHAYVARRLRRARRPRPAGGRPT